MTVHEVLALLNHRGIRLLREGDRLRCNGPKGSLTPDLQHAIAEHKTEILALLRDSVDAPPPVHLADRSGPLPAWFAQERLWFLHQLQPDSTAYNLTAVVREEGRLSGEILSECLREVVRRHEALRTGFRVANGAPEQLIVSAAEPSLEIVDLTAVPAGEREAALREHIRNQTERPFDLGLPPLLRVSLLWLDENRYVVAATFHHIICDGWSLGVFFRDLHACYRSVLDGSGASLPPLPFQYADYVCSERERLSGAVLERKVAYWREKLKGSPQFLELPADHPRPQRQSHRGETYSFALPPSTSEMLASMGRSAHATTFMTALSVYVALLFRYTHQEDIVAGTPVSMRNRPELENLIGMLVNTVLLRTKLTAETTARQLLALVRETVLEAHAQSDTPLETLIAELKPERNLSYSPFCQVAFVLQNTPHSLSYETTGGGSMFDLTLFMWETGGRLCGSFEYCTDLFEKSTIARMAEHFRVLADGMARQPDVPIGQLDILTATERRQILNEWSGTRTDYPRDKTIAELFEEQARLRPEAPALIVPSNSLDQVLTYGEIDRRANGLAARLRRMHVTPGMRVCVCLERSPEAVVAIVAILKAGGAYVPIDPAYPAERQAFMLADSGAAVVITSSLIRESLTVQKGKVLLMDEIWDLLPQEESIPAPAGVSSESAAYLMYTSGSTGEPKAVVVPNRAVVRLVKNTNYVHFGTEEAFLAAAPMTFDASTFELWGALLNGGRVVMVPERIPTPSRLAGVIDRYGVTTVWLTAGLFHNFVDTHLDHLARAKQILAGGDVLSIPHVNRMLGAMRGGVLVNGYGPTENTTFTCCHIMKPGECIAGTVPIGRPIANTSVYVLDPRMQPVPAGVKGQLFTGGDGLALGYHRRDDLNAEKFVPDPFAASPGARLYRTGDLVRYRPDGTLEFLGRSDDQVKIRGFRVEPGEIETLLRQNAQVRDAAVIVLRAPDGYASLACYVAPSAGAPLDVSALRAYLSARLPDHMVPASFTGLVEIPLTENGKVDRRRLPAPAKPPAGVLSAGTEVERQLACVWQQVLGVPTIGVRDNFFDLGGHSLAAVNLFDQLESFFGPLPLSLLFEAPTIEQMAARLEQLGFDRKWKSLVALQSGGSKRPLFFVPGLRGNALAGLRLARAIGPGRPVYAFHSLGLDYGEPPLDRIEDIAAHFLAEMRTAQQRGPYHIAGACMGGTVAYEMAQQLRARGEEVASLTLIETWPPSALRQKPVASRAALRAPVLFARVAWAGLRALSEMPAAERVPFLRDKFRAVANLVRGRKLPGRLQHVRQIAVEQANYLAVCRYNPRHYDGRLQLIIAAKRRLKGQKDARLLWSSLAGGKCDVHYFDAENSGLLLSEPWVHSVAEVLALSVRGAAVRVSAPSR